MVRIKGVWALPATSFTDEYQFDEKSYRNNIDYYIRSGVHGIIVNGSIGEFPSLSDSERKQILEVAIDQADGRVPVGSCTSACSTLQCIELSKHAQEAGAVLLQITPPYYWRPSEQEIINHYQLISDAVAIPISLYNAPFLTKVDISPELASKLVRIKNVKFMKESLRDFFKIYNLLQTGISVFAGSDTMALPVLQLGGIGATSSPLRAKEVVDVYNAFESGDTKSAVTKHKKVLATYIAGEEVNILPTMKAACNIRGIKVGPPRPPYIPLSKAQTAKLAKVLQKNGLI